MAVTNTLAPYGLVLITGLESYIALALKVTGSKSNVFYYKSCLSCVVLHLKVIVSVVTKEAGLVENKGTRAPSLQPVYSQAVTSCLTPLSNQCQEKKISK